MGVAQPVFRLGLELKGHRQRWIYCCGAENFGDTVSEMVFLRDFEAHQACIDEHKTGCLDMHNQEPGDPKYDTQYHCNL